MNDETIKKITVDEEIRAFIKNFSFYEKKEEEAKLWAKLSVNVLSIEEYYGKPRPDLTYTKK